MRTCVRPGDADLAVLLSIWCIERVRDIVLTLAQLFAHGCVHDALHCSDPRRSQSRRPARAGDCATLQERPRAYVDPHSRALTGAGYESTAREWTRKCVCSGELAHAQPGLRRSWLRLPCLSSRADAAQVRDVIDLFVRLQYLHRFVACASLRLRRCAAFAASASARRRHTFPLVRVALQRADLPALTSSLPAHRPSSSMRSSAPPETPTGEAAFMRAEESLSQARRSCADRSLCCFALRVAL